VTAVPTTPASAPRTARERVREEMTAEILAVAGAHVARDGAGSLSLRSIARDLGMAPSALYRYFDGRDALVTALILTAYEALAGEAERAADQAETTETAETKGTGAQGGPARDAERWLAVPRALRH
jgi:AcrR family transcriptional regulator